LLDGENGGVTLVPLPMPELLGWMQGAERCQLWLAALPDLVERATERWGLVVGEPFATSHVSWTAPVWRADGSDAVLKVQFPHPECEHEAEALRRWDGDGAIRLLDHHASDHALLLERCVPGTPLSDAPEAALGVLVGLLRRSLVPAGEPFTTLATEAASWAEQLPIAWEQASRPFERPLVDAALDLLRDLPTSASTESVLVHQDLHGQNVLRSDREPWLVIDPKPLAAEPAFAGAPIVRSNVLGHTRADVWRRVDAVADGIDVDRDRVAAWALAQTVSWSFHEDRAVARHVDTARWLLAGR
jgi:streptomycin 6-kinase